jgi:hypothetical protein
LDDLQLGTHFLDQLGKQGREFTILAKFLVKDLLEDGPVAIGLLDEVRQGFGNLPVP